MNLEFLSREAADKLAREVQNNLPAYRSGKTNSLIDSRDCRVSRLEVPEPPDLVNGDGEVKNDAEASKLIFQWLSTLTPVQASDERLWLLLTHRYFETYVHKRWAQKRFETATQPERVVLDRWFFRGRGLRTCVHNAVSRLWWFGYLTCDRNRPNPFELTDVLLLLQDIQTAFLERTLGPCRPVLKIVLEILKTHQKTLSETPSSGDIIQEWAKEIRLYGGAYLLDEVPEKRLRFVFERALKNRLNA